MANMTMPRWQRKAMSEKNSTAERTSTQTKTPSKRGAATPGDRFIPNRSTMDFAGGRHFSLAGENTQPAVDSPSKISYHQTLSSMMLGDKKHAKILAFSKKAPAPPVGYQNSLKVLYSQNTTGQVNRKKVTRHIPQAPERVLDAPDLLDDFYLNLLDWNKDNVLAVALGQVVYLWDAETSEIRELCTLEEPGNHITSLSWIEDGYVVRALLSLELKLIP